MRNKKLLLFSLFLAMFLIVACGRIEILIEPLEEPYCTLTINRQVYSSDGDLDFYWIVDHYPNPQNSSSSLDPFDLFKVSDFGFSWGISRSIIDGEYSVRAVTSNDEGWWFEVNGIREANNFSTVLSENPFRTDDPATLSQWSWIPSSLVSSASFQPPELICNNTGQTIDLNDIGDGVSFASLVYDCPTSIADGIDSIPAYVGPDINRPIVINLFADDGALNTVSQFMDESGNLWYEVQPDDRDTTVWIQSSDVQSPQCDIPEGEPPAIIPANNSVENPEDTSDGTCDSFALLSPTGPSVPTGNVTFSWTEVDDAEEYILWFYNYEGMFVETYTVPDTSITLNVGDLSTGSEFSWDAYAVYNGIKLCQTPRTDIITKSAAEVPEVVETEVPEVDNDDDDDNSGDDECDPDFDECEEPEEPEECDPDFDECEED